MVYGLPKLYKLFGKPWNAATEGTAGASSHGRPSRRVTLTSLPQWGQAVLSGFWPLLEKLQFITARQERVDTSRTP